jgi:hypothetical protein
MKSRSRGPGCYCACPTALTREPCARIGTLHPGRRDGQALASGSCCSLLKGESFNRLTELRRFQLMWPGLKRSSLILSSCALPGANESTPRSQFTISDAIR